MIVILKVLLLVLYEIEYRKNRQLTVADFLLYLRLVKKTEAILNSSCFFYFIVNIPLMLYQYMQLPQQLAHTLVN